MYRVSLITTSEFSAKEAWLEAVTVRESASARQWEFLDADGHVVRRFDKTRVRAIAEASDRRKPNHPRLERPAEDVWNRRRHNPTSRWEKHD